MKGIPQELLYTNASTYKLGKYNVTVNIDKCPGDDAFEAFRKTVYSTYINKIRRNNT